jgi:hypothetical protein
MGTEEMVSQFITPIVAPVLGQRAWGARLGLGSFITVEFGPTVPPSTPRRRAHGAWHLWITYAAWRLEKRGQTVAACEDARLQLHTAVESLNGLVLLAIDILTPALDTLFVFDEDVTVRAFPIYSEQYDHWQLFTPDGNVLVLGPDATWTYQSAALP